MTNKMRLELLSFEGNLVWSKDVQCNSKENPSLLVKNAVIVAEMFEDAFNYYEAKTYPMSFGMGIEYPHRVMAIDIDTGNTSGSLCLLDVYPQYLNKDNVEQAFINYNKAFFVNE